MWLYAFFVFLIVVWNVSVSSVADAQAVPYARTYAKSKEEVSAALNEMQANSGQKLPIVDGFVAVSEQPLNRFERAFYQFSIELLPAAANGTVVRLTAKITAWYADPDPSKSGYQLLPSNGRLELDLLDRLTEKFGGKHEALTSRSNLQTPRPKLDISAGGLPENTSLQPRISPSPAGASPGAAVPNSEPSETAALRIKRENEEKRMLQLKSELEGFQEIQRNQAHPRNLVIVKKPNTPVLARPAEGSKVLFEAAAEDEFEFIEVEGEWFHVQISGASRGWIRRSQAEAMDPRWNAAPVQAKAEVEKPPIFRVIREENSLFPGDWAPLKGQTVKVYWVQPDASPTAATNPGEKREFTKTLFQRARSAASSGQNTLAGVVVIFDTPDGGQVSATMSALLQWMDRKIPESSFWEQSSVDPAELFKSVH
jgi:hypothetical protein